MINAQKLFEFVEKQWDEDIIPSLCEYIKIPNKSPHFDAHWQEHGYMDKAVKHIADWCEAHSPQNMTLEIMRIPGRTPLIFMDVPGNTDETVVLYGHLDKQPEMTGWSDGLGPWTPVLKDGCLYGRGGADDGYAAYASITAINALQEQGIAHARCVLIIEACEESGSYDLPYYMDLLQDRIGKPNLVICLDSGAGNYDQLWMTTSLRGNVVGELSVELIREGVHSGYASGIVADSFRVAKQLISRVENEVTGDITLQSLHADIPAKRMKEAAECAAVLGDEVYNTFPFHSGVRPVTDDRQQLILNRTWRPALTVTGADGIPSIVDAGNVMRPKTALKLSMRLPPTVCPKEASASLQKALTDNPPYGAKVAFSTDNGAMGWHAPLMAEWLEKAVNDASMTFFNQKAVYMGEGGTIPFMGMLGETFPEAQFVITGVLGPRSNAHGPNEFLHLDMGKKVTACVAFILYQHREKVNNKLD